MIAGIAATLIYLIVASLILDWYTGRKLYRDNYTAHILLEKKTTTDVIVDIILFPLSIWKVKLYWDSL